MEQTSLNLGTIGQRLEAARLEKGVTVSEVGQTTRILPKVIEAMEADNFTSLAAPVYVKGFIRLYAQYLGMDPDPLICEYSGEQPVAKGKPSLPEEVKKNLAKADVPPSEAAVSPGKRKKIFSGTAPEPDNHISGASIKLIIGGLSAVILLGFVVLSVRSCETDDGDVPEPQAPAPAAREALFEEVPNVYLVKPGVIELEQ